MGGTAVRTLNYNDAKGQYPQTPMQVKFGSVVRRRPVQPAGHGGLGARAHRVRQRAFTMTARSIVVSDYSTGKQYKYGDTSGTWQSVQAVDGKVNANVGNGGPTRHGHSGGRHVALAVGAARRHRQGQQHVVPVRVAVGATASANSNTIPSGWVMTPSRQDCARQLDSCKYVCNFAIPSPLPYRVCFSLGLLTRGIRIGPPHPLLIAGPLSLLFLAGWLRR